MIYDINDRSTYARFKITGASTDASGYVKLAVAHLASNNTFSAADELSITFVRNGDTGDTGSQGIQGNTGNTGSTGASGTNSQLSMTWNSSTSDADPGAGKIAFNNGTISSVSILYVDDADDASADISSFVQSWDDVSNGVARGIVTITKEGTASTYATFKVSGAVTDASGYTKVPVTHVVSSGTFSNTDGVGVHFSYSGADGTGDIDGVTAGTGLSGGGTSGTVTLNVDLLSKIEGTNFTDSLLIGHTTTGTLNAAQRNIGIGKTALDALTSGDDNIALGYGAGSGVTTGKDNIGIGSYSIFAVQDGTNNIGVGRQAATNTTSGDDNTSIGYKSSYFNATGSDNTALGSEALEGASGQNNSSNTAIGAKALTAVTTGNSNIGLGKDAGDNITSGDGNVIIGSIDADSATGNRQLIIAGNDGSTTTTWISGDSNGQVKLTSGYIAEIALTDASTITWNAATQPVAKVTLGASRTMGLPSNPVSGQFISLLIIQDGTGSRTITWNAAYEFAADTAPTLTATANLGDLFTFRYNGAKWLEVGRNLALTLS